jgi:hypothetical protein
MGQNLRVTHYLVRLKSSTGDQSPKTPSICDSGGEHSLTSELAKSPYASRISWLIEYGLSLLALLEKNGRV